MREWILAIPFPARCFVFEVSSASVVVHADEDCFIAGHHLHRHGMGVGVFEGVVEQFLHDPVHHYRGFVT